MYISVQDLNPYIFYHRMSIAVSSYFRQNMTGPKTLPTIWHTYTKLVTKYQIAVINICLEKCDEKYLGLTHRDKQYTPLPLQGMGV
jgi:hypothetical protein